MALEQKTKEQTGSLAWRYLDGNNICPLCNKVISQSDNGIEYSRTIRGTHMFFHGKCAKQKNVKE